MVRKGPNYIAAGSVLLAVLALLLLPLPGLTPQTRPAAALVVFAIGCWATGALPEYLTALAFFLAAMLFKIAPPDIVFSGFSSTAFWLVFSGLIIGAAVKRTGLGERLAERMTGRGARSYGAVIAAIVAVGTVLSFLMPSSLGRAVLLTPIILALADNLGFAPGSRGRTGMVVATGLIAYMPGAAILPAAVPNMVLIGAAETQYALPFNYAHYLLLHFPVLGFLKCLAIIGVIGLLFSDMPAQSQASGSAKARPKLSRDEKILAVLLLAALALWATDLWHGISPAWIGLAVAVICLLPGIGLVPAAMFNEKINYASLFYVAGVLGLGAVAAHTGLGKLAGGALMAVLPLAPGADAADFFSLSGLAMLTGLITTVPGVPAVLTPLAQGLAEASGLPLLTVLMTQVVGYSTILLPYQTPPLVVVMQMGAVRLADGLRATLALAAVTVLVLIPLDYLWWRVLGLLD